VPKAVAALVAHNSGGRSTVAAVTAVRVAAVVSVCISALVMAAASLYACNMGMPLLVKVLLG